MAECVWRSVVVAATLGLGAATACAQQDAPAAELQRVLAKLGAAALALEQTLPSFTCEESVVSREMRGGTVRRQVEFTATVRAQRQASGRLGESFQITQVDGKPFSEGHFKAPVMVSGGFDQAMRYFHPEQQHCYEFALSPGRVDFKDAARPGCKETGLAGFARLDADETVTYIERTVPVETAKPLHLASFATVEFAPVTMGDRTYRLSQHMVAELPDGKSIGRFEATYSHCRLFRSTATIGPAEIVPDDAGTPRP